MVYRVDLAARATRDLRRIYRDIKATQSKRASAWFNGLETAILRLEVDPARHPVAPENAALRHLLYGRKGRVYRVIYAIDDGRATVTVLHIRHWARQPLQADRPLEG